MASLIVQESVQEQNCIAPLNGYQESGMKKVLHLLKVVMSVICLPSSAMD